MRIREISKSMLLCGALSLITHSARAKNETDSVLRIDRQLDETTVTALKPVKEIKAATPTFTLDNRTILRSGITDIADALHRLPGVNLRDYGGAGGLKTVSVRGLGASHTTVTYDGLALSDAQSGAIDLSRYSVDNAGSLSLIIGDNDEVFIPARTASAPATLALTTPALSADKSLALDARLKVGSFGYVSPYLNVSTAVSKHVTLNVNGEFVHARNNYPFEWVNGKVVTREKRENNRMNSGHIEGNMLWQPNVKDVFKAKIYYYDNNRQLPGPVLYYNTNGSREHLHEKNSFAQATYNHSFSRHWKMMAAAKFNWSASLYSDFGTLQAGNVIQENYFQREAYATFNVLYNPSERWSFDYSADYFLNTLNSNLPTDTRPRRNSFLQSLTAKWTLSRLAITGRLIESMYFNSTGVKGARRPADFNRLNPSLSLSARLLSEGLLYARLSYKNIFRMPTFNEAFFNHYGSDNLQPESTHQLDFGLTYQLPQFPFLPMTVVTADVYRNWITDRIVAVPYNIFIWTVTNVNSVITTGADVTLNSTFNVGKRQAIVASGTWSYQRARIDTDKESKVYGKQVAYTPLNTGSFSMAYENPWVNVVWHGQGVSARYTDNLNTPSARLAGYFEFGATLWKEIAMGKTKIELRLDVLNILDKQYYIIARYPMPGRAWQASVKFSM